MILNSEEVIRKILTKLGPIQLNSLELVGENKQFGWIVANGCNYIQIWIFDEEKIMDVLFETAKKWATLKVRWDNSLEQRRLDNVSH